LHVTSGFTPGIVLADVLLLSRHRPAEIRERRPRRAVARHAVPVALAGCHAGPVEIAAGRISKRIRSLGLIAG
jgi:hypothetical protein